MNIQQALAAAKQATDAGKLTASALANLTVWLTENRYRSYQPQIVEHIAANDWKKLDDVFWTVIPFGTGGRRGRMYAFGSNAINERTIGESAQGLATYVLEVAPKGKPLSCAIAYDTRHRSREFAELCASVMVANGFEVYFLDDYRADAAIVVRRARKAMRLWHHGHGQSQSAQRQRSKSLLVNRRSSPTATRQGDHRSRDECRRDQEGGF